MSERWLLEKEHTILERPFMEFRPFGSTERGEKIRDLSGMAIWPMVEHLERSVAQRRGGAAGTQAIRELCRLLNERIKDPVYHVTPAFLGRRWNSYSCEFAAYLYEFCEQLSGDPRFAFVAGHEKASPIMQTLARPFPLATIYTMFPYFANKYAPGSLECDVKSISGTSARLTMRFTEHAYRQFGPYRKRCAYLRCQAAQGLLSAVPERVHRLPAAQIHEHACIAEGDQWCEWDIVWSSKTRYARVRRLFCDLSPHERLNPNQIAGRKTAVPDVTAPNKSGLRTETVLRQDSPQHVESTMSPRKGQIPGNRSDHERSSTDLPSYFNASGNERSNRVERSSGQLVWFFASMLGGLAAFAYLHLHRSFLGVAEEVGIALSPGFVAWVVTGRRMRRQARQREAVIHEQVKFVEARHEELREAYLEQEQTRVELRRKVNQLTALHRAGLLFNSTLDREALLQQVLKSLTTELHYDRAMISFFDPVRQVSRDARVIGVSPDIEAFVRSCEIPVTDPRSLEGTVLLRGQPLLIGNVQAVIEQLHPVNQQLVGLTKTKALIAVPLKTKDRIFGTLTVDRMQEDSLTQDDLELMATIATQVAISLDNASAYQQIEELNVGLEAKVRERTAELEQADRIRSRFLSHVSHELKTPLTSIKGFLQNLLDGLTGPVNDKQQRYLSRMLDNSDRLIRMIDDLLDQTRIQTGRLDLVLADVDLGQCVADAIEQLRPLAQVKRHRLDVRYPSAPLIVRGDRDRLIQIAINLVQNAIKFTPDEGHIVVMVEEKDQALASVSVRDSGPGIPPEFIDKIFDPFFKIKETRRGSKGLGLGLSIVRTLVELHGGTIEARSTFGHGTELYFTIPIAPPAHNVREAIRIVEQRVLVVDDDADIRQLLHDRLTAKGYEVREAADGIRAVESVRTDSFSGLILDIGISQIDGLEVLRQIREWDQQLPIVMVTASGSRDLAIRAIGMGAQAYLLKPFDADELHRVIDCWFKPT
jgi:signal transduction histidine kinase/CheY-like chemotaxis protein